MYNRIKRGIDFFLALLGLIVLSPVFLILIIVIVVIIIIVVIFKKKSFKYSNKKIDFKKEENYFSENKKINVKPLISKILPFDKALEGFELNGDKETIKRWKEKDFEAFVLEACQRHYKYLQKQKK